MVPEVRKINLSLMNWSIGAMVIGDERSFTDSGDVWEKGMARFGLTRAPLDA
jgi:hypothetical protein